MHIFLNIKPDVRNVSVYNCFVDIVSSGLLNGVVNMCSNGVLQMFVVANLISVLFYTASIM